MRFVPSVTVKTKTQQTHSVLHENKTSVHLTAQKYTNRVHTDTSWNVTFKIGLITIKKN